MALSVNLPANEPLLRAFAEKRLLQELAQLQLVSGVGGREAGRLRQVGESHHALVLLRCVGSAADTPPRMLLPVRRCSRPRG